MDEYLDLDTPMLRRRNELPVVTRCTEGCPVALVRMGILPVVSRQACIRCPLLARAVAALCPLVH